MNKITFIAYALLAALCVGVIGVGYHLNSTLQEYRNAVSLNTLALDEINATLARLRQAEGSRLGASGVKTCTTTAISVSASTSTLVLATSTSRRSAALVLGNSTTTYIRRGLAVTSSTGLPLTALGSSRTWDEESDPYIGVVTAISSNGTTTIFAEQCQ
ncbi:MAG: hypothetical protein Q8L86_12515 [Vicinamibacterales bacterium]|nr:hypothetical protein [Vicinamibacterales bacterium]